MIRRSWDIDLLGIPLFMHHIFRNFHKYPWICKLDNLHIQQMDEMTMSKLLFDTRFSSLT